MDDFLPMNPFQMPLWTDEKPNETEEEANARAQATQRAIETSTKIEAWLLDEKKALERRKRGIKILLLGQSESGKSSVLKNFQLAYAPKQFEKDRSAWKTIVQLNVIGSIKTILDALDEECVAVQSQPPSKTDTVASYSLLTRMLRLGLSPLFLIESNLLKVMAPECADCRKLTVRAGTDWKALLDSKTRLRTSSQDYDLTSVLAAQRRDIISLWQNPEVQQILSRRRPRLHRSSGFFMADIERITTPDYLPTDSDVIRARLETTGVEEHHFIMELNKNVHATDFYITDVGGAWKQRASWVSFFDDAQCILFLAPLAFNEFLEEDPKANRLEDSLQLWKAVCQNKLLANAEIVLFLNKRDILESTLMSGVRVQKYVPSYKDRPNDIDSVTKYFKDKFKQYHKKYSPLSRSFLCHETSAIDIKSMRLLLITVRESLWRQLLTRADLL